MTRYYPKIQLVGTKFLDYSIDENPFENDLQLLIQRIKHLHHARLHSQPDLLPRADNVLYFADISLVDEASFTQILKVAIGNGITPSINCPHKSVENDPSEPWAITCRRGLQDTSNMTAEPAQGGATAGITRDNEAADTATKQQDTVMAEDNNADHIPVDGGCQHCVYRYVMEWYQFFEAVLRHYIALSIDEASGHSRLTAEAISLRRRLDITRQRLARLCQERDRMPVEGVTAKLLHELEHFIKMTRLEEPIFYTNDVPAEMLERLDSPFVIRALLRGEIQPWSTAGDGETGMQI